MSELLVTLSVLVGGILAQHRKCDVLRGRPLSFINRTAEWAIFFYIFLKFTDDIKKMATKRKVEAVVPAEESDQLLIRPL